MPYSLVNIHYGHDNIKDTNKYSNYTIRDLMRKYKYTEEKHDLVFKDFVYESDRDEIPIPEWWNDKNNKPHSRLPRGAVNKFVYSLNSAISNYKNRNISKFTMKPLTKKSYTNYLHFEDSQYPAFIRRMKSRYWYTTPDRQRKTVSLSDIDCSKRGIEIIYEKETDRYFLHYPVDRDWYPRDDRRIDSQDKYVVKGDRIISLDPGVRKFLVGYDPLGFSVFIGNRASIELTKLLLEIDKLEQCKKMVKYKQWKRVKCLISENGIFFGRKLRYNIITRFSC